MAHTTTQLPSDPDQQNDDRATWAEDGLRSFARTVGLDFCAELDDVVADFLADLAHFCDLHDISFADRLSQARTHYLEETDQQGSQL